MKNLLAIDIGNTNIAVGLFKGKRLAGKTKIRTFSYSSYIRRMRALIKELQLSIEEAGEAVISSVVPLALVRLVAGLR
jgi:pantothenate kinase type III